MKFTYSVNKNLPPLAWIATCQNGDVDVLCGDYVEISGSCFVSGAWSGNFSDNLFEQAEWFCGTGGKIDNNRVIFSTPTHVTEALYLAEVRYGSIIVSNSLCFLLSKLEYHLDVNYLNYEVDFNTITQGIHKYKRDIYVLDKENNATTVKVFYYRNIIIDEQNKWEEAIKPSIKPFASFEDYYSRLLEAMSLLKENACDNERNKSFGIVSTISKGYDAPTCSVIAKKIGGDTAVTFKAEGKYAEDSGVEIAKHLNFKNIIERDALEYKTNKEFIEAYYLCTGELGASISFSAFDDDFKGNLVFTGERGDSIWSCASQSQNNMLCFENATLNHLGVCERHLWLGYITVPMPLFGASSWESIYKISCSEEMESFRTNNNYDRPIPRRICEEAGLERNSFGIDKHGAGFVYKYDTLNRIKARMSQYSADSFSKYVKTHKKPHLIQIFSYFLKMRNFYLFFMVQKLRLNKLGIKVSYPLPRYLIKISNPTTPRYLIPWAVSIVVGKYKKLLK